MAQKTNSIIFRKNSKGFYFVHNRLSFLNNLFFTYSLKNYNQLQFFLKNFFAFFNLCLNSFSSIETNNSVFFISIRYRSQQFKKTKKNGKLLKQTIVKGLLRLIPVKSLYLRLINNRKIFFVTVQKKKINPSFKRS